VRRRYVVQREWYSSDPARSRSFAGFAFLQSVIGAMVQHNNGAGGSVLVTGATSSTRGREGFAG
jgi:hypothetical protein